MDLNEKLDLAAEVKHKGNEYFKVQSSPHTFLIGQHIIFNINLIIKWYYPLLIGRTALSGSHPVPAHCFLAWNGVWYWLWTTEEDTRLYFDITPQFSIVLPADKRVFTSSGELQQGDDCPCLNTISFHYIVSLFFEHFGYIHNYLLYACMCRVCKRWLNSMRAMRRLCIAEGKLVSFVMSSVWPWQTSSKCCKSTPQIEQLVLRFPFARARLRNIMNRTRRHTLICSRNLQNGMPRSVNSLFLAKRRQTVELTFLFSFPSFPSVTKGFKY